MAKEDKFNSLLRLQKKRQNDGTKEELVLKFFAYLRHRDEFKGRVKDFLNDYMAAARENYDEAADTALFKKSVDALGASLNGSAFIRPSDKVTPLNALEACLVAIGELLGAGSVVNVPPDHWIEDAVLAEHSSKGTNAPSSLRARIERAKEIFSESVGPAQPASDPA
jgi:hypothetical protein